ncbi:hypothetical protein PoB_003074800 [Plakobranchus ocellatus]|uniref:Uncharacterized protein n=1 Tax=Plakobranchus ocellatus TaxID=259542 RepID=A0AAV4ACI0_9GAST|nr:hypothetical protein PoB_003074800 [Plakobranchus ocellatus]
MHNTSVHARFRIAQTGRDSRINFCTAQRQKRTCRAKRIFFKMIKAAEKELKQPGLSHPNPIEATDQQTVKKVQTATYSNVRDKEVLSLSTHFFCVESSHLPDEEDHGVQRIKAAVSMFVRVLMKHQTKLLTNRFVQVQLPLETSPDQDNPLFEPVKSKTFH